MVSILFSLHLFFIFISFGFSALFCTKYRKIRIAAKPDAEERAVLKNQRFTLLRNEENLSSEASAYLSKINQTFQELIDVHMMKEALRSICSVVQSVSRAEDELLPAMDKGHTENPIRSTVQNGKDHITTLGWNSGIPAFRKCDKCLYGGGR